MVTGGSTLPAAPAVSSDLYQTLIGKTVFLPSDLTWPTQPLPELGTNQAEAAAKMESYLLANGITVIHDGPRFVRLLPTRRVDELLTNAPLRADQLKPSSDSNKIPAGGITFINVQLADVLSICAELRSRTILRPEKLPYPTVTLKNATALTREEAAYAIETALAMNGLNIIEDGDKFVQIVPASKKAHTRPNAPKADLSAELINPKEVPVLGLEKTMSTVERDLQRLKKAVYDLLQFKAPPQRPAQRLLDLYALLTDKTPDRSPTNSGGMPIWFHVNTSLSKQELLYAIETTFRLNDLMIVARGDEMITLEKASRIPASAANPTATLSSNPTHAKRRWSPVLTALVICSIVAFFVIAISRLKARSRRP
jgi:hypothetical protein